MHLAVPCNVIRPHSSGTYKCKQSLPFSALTTAQQSGGRGRREAEVPFCNDDPRKGNLIDSHQLVSTAWDHLTQQDGIGR